MFTFRSLTIYLIAGMLCFAGHVMADVSVLESGASQQSGKIAGVVQDEAGPVIGAAVTVKGTTNGTVTDADGKFTLDKVKQGDVIQISYLGYVTQGIAYTGQSLITVNLVEDAKALSEVVVLGYGASARKADLSAAIGTIENIEAVKQRPVTSVAGMLQGQIAGVTVRNESGDPSREQTITIRGNGSRGISGNAEKALVVVDGVPDANYNVDEVESVVVLKDAASAAIYGAYSGSAGVILVTTKKAKAGVTSVTYDGTYGINHAVNLPQSLTAEEEIRVKTASAAADGNNVDDGWNPAKNPYVATTRTDWIDVLFRDALFQRHTVAFSGGSETLSSRLSLNYTNNEGIMEGTFNESFQLRYNAMFKPVKWVKITEDAWVTNSRSHGGKTPNGYDGSLQDALGMPRSAEPYYSDGTLGGVAPKDPAYAAQYGQNFSGIHGDLQNPLRGLVDVTEHKLPLNFNSSTFLEVGDVIPGLRFTSRFTYRLNYNWEKTFDPKVTEPGKTKADNTLWYKANRASFVESENTLNFDRTFGDHTIGALVSMTYNDWLFREFRLSAATFDNEQESYQYLNFAKVYRTPEDRYDIDRNLAYVGRVSYSYANRYFVTASLRRDYAGRLPKGAKSGDFPSVTAAWKLSEESFMPKSDMLNLLKLRGSWGRIGNINSIDRSYGTPALGIYTFSKYDMSGGMIGKDNPNMSMGISAPGAFNPYLTWETSEQTDFGIDVELLDHRLSFSADWFNKRTFNLIKQQDFGWPSTIGVGQKLINEGEITNTGLEFSAGWRDKAGDVEYFINGNLSTLKNKITDIGSVDPATGKKADWIYDENYRGVLRPFRSQEGGQLYSYWLLKTDGLFQSDAEAEAYVDKDGNRIQPAAKAGDLKFVDKNGDGKLDDNDREYMGAYFPELTYALNAGFTWKNLTFSFMLQGVEGVKAFNAFKYVMLNENGVKHNRDNRILNAWSETNKGSDIPRLTARDPNQNFARNSDWYLEDASYLRVKNITLAYDLAPLLRKVSYFRDRKSALSLSLGADNICTFTKYTGVDPEVGQINPNEGGYGLDGGSYPVSATYTLGLKLTF